MLAKQFRSPEIAEKHYQSLSQAPSVPVVPTTSVSTSLLPTISLPQIPNVSSTELTISQPPMSSLIMPAVPLPELSTIPPLALPQLFTPLSCPSASIITQSSVSSCSVVPSSYQSAILQSANTLSSSTPLQCDSSMTVGHILSAVSITPLLCTSRTVPSTSLSTVSNSWSCAPPPQSSQSSQCDLSITVGHVLSKLSSDGDLKPDPVEVEKICQEQLQILSSDQQCKVLSKLFSIFVMRNTDNGCLPGDFLELCVHAMTHLKHCHRSNIIYLLAKALGTMRSD